MAKPFLIHGGKGCVHYQPLTKIPTTKPTGCMWKQLCYAGRERENRRDATSMFNSRLTDARQQTPTGADMLCASLCEPPRCIVGVVPQQVGVSLPGRRDLTVRADSPGIFGFEILMHCGSWGVLWERQAQQVLMLACCPDCAKGTCAHLGT